MWDTGFFFHHPKLISLAGQEKFRSLTSSYYRGTHGVLLGISSLGYLKFNAFLVYDVTRRNSFEALDHWLKEIDLYATNRDCIKLLIGNKIDKVFLVLFVDFPVTS